MLDAAVAALQRREDCTNVVASSWLETDPVGGPGDQGAFLNGAAAFDTQMAPAALLEVLFEIERSAGRERRVRWGPRTLDLDLLLYGSEVIRTARLETPHPRMSFRRFVMDPAAEAAADMIHPLIGWPLARLARHLRTARLSVAVAAEDASLVERLAAEMTRRLAELSCGWEAFSPDRAIAWESGPPRLVVLLGRQSWTDRQHARLTELGCGPRLVIDVAEGSPAGWGDEVSAAAAAML